MSILPGYCIREGCERPRIGTLEICASHAKEIRDEEAEESKPKKVYKGLQRGGPVKKVSDNRAEELKEYKPLRKQFIEDHPECEARLEGCTQRTTDVHHKSLSALDFLNVSTWLGACRNCHILLEALPAEKRREMAFLIDVKERPTI